ncbi:MAG: hypothetical protein KDA81_19810 [Planctomycetaceae bacterium]|nr:hypothetical protein [Planctomycetaceae bacterium]
MKTTSLKTLVAGLVCVCVTGIASAQDPFFASGSLPYDSRVNEQHRNLPAAGYADSYQARQLQYRNSSQANNFGYRNTGLDYRIGVNNSGLNYRPGTSAGLAPWQQGYQPLDTNGNPIHRTGAVNWGTYGFATNGVRQNGAGHHTDHGRYGASVNGQCANGNCDCSDGQCDCAAGPGSCAGGQCGLSGAHGNSGHNHNDMHGAHNTSINPVRYNSRYTTGGNIQSPYLPAYRPYGY